MGFGQVTWHGDRRDTTRVNQRAGRGHKGTFGPVNGNVRFWPVGADRLSGVTALDPTAQVLLTIFGAAIVTALAGFAGAAFQARRDHRRWIRERRFEAYVDWLKYAHELRDMLDDLERLRTQSDQIGSAIKTAVDARAASDVVDEKNALTLVLNDHHEKAARMQGTLGELDARRKLHATQLIDRGAAFFLLGPKPVVEAASRIADALDEDSATVHRAIERMEFQMRRALRVNR